MKNKKFVRETCENCYGAGVIKQKQFIVGEKVGKIYISKCSVCGGTGYQEFEVIEE